MLDFVLSKMAMMVAAVFIILAGIGIYEIQKDAVEDEELQNLADKIAKTVNELSALNANTNVNFTFSRNTEGIYLKPTIGEETYTIRITQNFVFLTQRGRSVASNFIKAVHVWEPEKGDYNGSEFSDMDETNREMEISPGRDTVIVVERKEIGVNGMLGYYTFVYSFD